MKPVSHLYFVFNVRQSLYAVEALSVSVTFSVPALTATEEAPAYVAGVINLRGHIIPVLDLNLLFGRPSQDKALSDAVLVLQDKERMVGVLVNEVLDVIHIRADQIDQPIRGEDKAEALDAPACLVLGMARVDHQIINILDHRRLVALDVDLADGTELAVPTTTAAEEPVHPVPTTTVANEPQSADQAVLQRRAIELTRLVEADINSDTLQLAVVVLGQEYFGLDIRFINEFTKAKNIIPLPNCPQHVLGNMNLRGNILTIIDIRQTLGMYSDNFQPSAKIVVSSAADILVGVAVDDIDDIVQLDRNQIVPLPVSAHPDVLRFALGTAHYNQKAMTILNLPEILKNKDLIVDER